MDRLIALRGSKVVSAAAPSAQEESSAASDAATTSSGAEPSLRSSAANEGTGSHAAAADYEAGMLPGRAHATEAEGNDANAREDCAGQAAFADVAALLRSYAQESKPHFQVLLCKATPSSLSSKTLCSRDSPLSVEGRQAG